MMRTMLSVMVALLLWAGTGAAAGQADKAKLPEIPTPGMVTLVELSAEGCMPCLMMAPMIEQLRRDYQGRASIIAVDVGKHQKLMRRFGIYGVPTLIFYDAQGREVARHIGLLDRATIVAALTRLGVE